jgi:hypothetical protein
MFVIQGLLGPKLRSKDVSDGYAVNILQLITNRYELWGDRGGDSKVSIGRDSNSKLV